MIASLTPWLLAAGGLLIAFVTAIFKARLDGAKLERAKQQEAEAKARDISDQVDNDLGAVPPDKQREELRQWGR